MASSTKRKPRIKTVASPSIIPVATAMTIIDALDDPTLFGKFFDGESWDGWRTILKAVFALPMEDTETAFFKSISGDRAVPSETVREFWAIVGRRGGKDSLASAVAAFAAAMFNQQHKLRPGERGCVLCLGVDREQSSLILNYIRSLFTDIPMLKAMLTRETATGFELNNSIDIVIATNNFRSIRGRAVLLAIFDECAFYRDESSSKPDEELYKAIVPSLASLSPGSMIIGISSPYRKSGLLYKKYTKHFGRDGDVLVIQAPTRVLNPTIPQEIIDRALEEDPAGARAEWLAEFRDDIGGWLSVEIIEAAVDRGITVRPPATLHQTYRAAADPAGGSGKDSFTLAVSHTQDDVGILDLLLEIKPPFNPSDAVGEISSVLRAYGLTEVVGDAYAADWVVSAFASHGIKYTHSDRNRSEIYRDCLPLFTSGRARLLDNPRLVSQFASLERKTSTMGKDRIDHGPGGHDDLCNSAALALVLATSVAKYRGLLFA
jgi:hypothetical protein